MTKKIFVAIQMAFFIFLNENSHAQVEFQFDKNQTMITELILSTSDDKELERLSFERIKERAESSEGLVNLVDL